MKKTSKLIIFVLALCVMAFSTYAVAAADGEEQEPVWTVEANYPSFDEAAKDIFAYDNPFDYLTVKKDDEVVAYDEYKEFIESVAIEGLEEEYFAFDKENGTIRYYYVSDEATDGNYEVSVSFNKEGLDSVTAYVKVTKHAPEGTLYYDFDKLVEAREAAEKGLISGTTYTIPKAEMRAIINSEVYKKDDLHVAVYVVKPNSNLPTSATSTKDDGTYPTISLSDSGTYSYWIIYGDKDYDEESRFTMATTDLKFKGDGWYTKGNENEEEELVIPVFSFEYDNNEGLTVTASGGGEDGVVNRVYSSITFNIKNGTLAKNGITLEYCADGDGKDADWKPATETEAEFDASSFTVSSISFTPKKTGYFRVKCVAQADDEDVFKYATAVVSVQKEYTEVELVDTRLRDFFTNNWKSLIFFGLAVLSLVGILVVALYKPKAGGAKKAVIKEDAEEKAAEADAEIAEEEAEEAAEEPVEETEEEAEEPVAETEEATEEKAEEPAEEKAEEPAEEPAAETEEKAEESAEEKAEEKAEEPAGEPVEEKAEEPTEKPDGETQE